MLEKKCKYERLHYIFIICIPRMKLTSHTVILHHEMNSLHFGKNDTIVTRFC